MSKNDVSIWIRAKDLTGRAWRSAMGHMGKFKKRVRSFASGTAKAFGGLLKSIGLLGGAIAGGSAWFIKAASDAEETDGKFAAVMKHMKAEADAWAGTFSDSVKRNKTEVKGWMSTLQDTFVPLGFTREKSLELSKSLTSLTVDLASFNNKAEPKVLEDLQSAIVGNHETMRKYGVILTDATVRQEAVRLGLAANTKEVDDAAKVQARYSLIMQGTTDAQGDALRTSESFANRMRGLKASVQTAREEIGKQIIAQTGLSDVIGKLDDKVRDFTKSGRIELWSQNAQKAFQAVLPVAMKIGDFFGKMKQWIQQGAAFAGGFVGAQGGMAERLAAAKEMARTIPEAVEKEKAARLELIREEKAAQAEKLAAEEAATAEIEKQKEIAQQRATEEQKAAEQRAKEEEAATRAAEKRLQLEQQAADIRERINADNEKRHFQKEVKDADNDMAAAKAGLAELQKTKAQERAERQAERDEGRAQRRLDRIKGKGGHLTPFERRLLKEDELKRNLADAQQAKANAKENLAQRAELAAQKSRDKMAASLANIEQQLNQNLQAV